jgi:hypothetical protein
MPDPHPVFGDYLGDARVDLRIYDLSDDSGRQTRIPDSLEDAEIVSYDFAGDLRVVHSEVLDAILVEWRNANSKRVVALPLDELAARMAQACMHETEVTGE